MIRREQVPAICPACGQQVEAVATDGRVKGYCTVAKQYVSFLIESQPGITALRDSEVSSTSAEQQWQDPEYRAKQSSTRIGKHPTAETRAKISAALTKRGVSYAATKRHSKTNNSIGGRV